MNAPLPPYTLIRAKRRTLSLAVQPDGSVLVRAPRLLPRTAIDRFVRDRADWIEKQRAIEALRPAHPFDTGDTLPFCGEALSLVCVPAARCVRRAGSVLTVPAGDREQVRARVIGWYRAQARAVFAARVRALAPLAGVTPGPVRVSSAKTRWGSCGNGDSVNLNWRLLLAPPEILDYVAVHELCHIGQRDHSGAFWARVAAIVPDWKQKREWLKRHRAELEL